MTEQQIHRPVDDDTLAALRDFTTSVGGALGHPALGDGVWRDLATASADSAIVTATDDDALIGVLHLGAPDAGGVVTGSLVVAPSARGRSIGSRLVGLAVDDLATRGTTRLEVWVFGDAGDIASSSDPPARALHEMRVKIPLTGADAAPTWPAGTRVRPFEPGRDDDAWLAVNNRAFAHDPDQGGWTPDVLHQRVAEPWFDPAGFLLAEDADGLAGFCWTKVHPPSTPFDPEPLGEIYVIAVDPGRQGAGLGHALVVAGLEWLARQGVTTGMLFVDAANTPAVGLYEALGFVTTRTDRLFVHAVGS